MTNNMGPEEPGSASVRPIPNMEIAYRPANEPIMNTSEWAKLMSCRTP
jgi:hypothetical protein